MRKNEKDLQNQVGEEKEKLTERGGARKDEHRGKLSRLPSPRPITENVSSTNFASKLEPVEKK